MCMRARASVCVHVAYYVRTVAAAGAVHSCGADERAYLSRSARSKVPIRERRDATRACAINGGRDECT